MTKLIHTLSFAYLYALIFSSLTSFCQGRRLLESKEGPTRTSTTAVNVDGTTDITGGLANSQNNHKKAPWDISTLDTDNWTEEQWDDWWKKLETEIKSNNHEYDLGGSPNDWPEWTAEQKKAAKTVGEDQLLADFLKAKKKRKIHGTN